METEKNGNGLAVKGEDMRKALLLVAVILAAWLAPQLAQAQPAGKQEALKAGLAWLALVDQGDYQQSWQQAAKLFQTIITQANWQKALTAVRRPLGAKKTRRLITELFKTSLPGAPDGQYWVFQFDSSFAAKQKALETLTLMREADGSWRAAGYYMR